MTKSCAEEPSELADDALADAILQELRKAGTWGLRKPSINVLFGRKAPVATVNIALARLQTAGKAVCERIPTRSGYGRRQIWYDADSI
jgi:hypothetical protein